MSKDSMVLSILYILLTTAFLLLLPSMWVSTRAVLAPLLVLQTRLPKAAQKDLSGFHSSCWGAQLSRRRVP